MPYLGRPVTNAGQFEIIDDISSGFNGSETSFTLQVGGTDIQPDSANVTIVLDGVVQIPPTAYSITGSTLNFSEAPVNGTGFHGVLAGQSQFIESGFITNTHISDSANISGSKINTDFSAQTVQAKIFSGMISSSAQISTDISGSLGSNAAIIRTLDRTTLSGSVTTVSSSLASRVTVNEGRVNQGVNTTDSPTFAGATITGTLTAQEVHTEFESASILFTSGSTKFGDTSNDTHSMTGSLLVSGSITMADGDLSVTDDVVFGATATVETGLNLESGTFTVKNATSDSNGLKISQGGSDASNILNHYNGTLNLGVANSVDMTLKGGSVGIGTDNPSFLLTAEAADGVMDNKNVVYIENKEATAGRNYGLYVKGGTNSSDANMQLVDTSNNSLLFIRGDGAVGIGSSSPTAKLDVNGGATINGNTIVGRGGNQKGRLTVQSRTGTATRKTNAIVAVPYNDTSESICMIGMDGQAGNNEMHIGSNTSDFMSPTYIDFFTASDVNSQTNNRAMRIDNTGAVLFNTTTRTSTGNGGATFDPNSVGRAVLNLGSVNYTSELDLVRLFNDNGEVGDIRTNGSGASFNSNSDYRLKENQVTLSNALTRLNNLKPYRFNFKADPSTTLDGFFAHEVQEVVPEAVTGTKDQMKPIQYQPGDDIPEGKEVYDIKEYSTTEIDAQKMDASKLVPLLVAALQEADDKIDALTTRIEVLEG